MDVLTREQRSYCMSRVRARDTTPELRLRQALWAEGFRYRIGHHLAGKPDVVFVADRVAVFIDGCFWHCCPIHATKPKTREAFWRDKLSTNVKRDRAVDRELTGEGWTVLRFWEHQVE